VKHHQLAAALFQPADDPGAFARRGEVGDDRLCAGRCNRQHHAAAAAEGAHHFGLRDAADPADPGNDRRHADLAQIDARSSALGFPAGAVMRALAPDAVSGELAAGASDAATAGTRPRPELEGRTVSACEMPPTRAIQAKTGGMPTWRRSTRAARASGRTRGM